MSEQDKSIHEERLGGLAGAIFFIGLTIIIAQGLNALWFFPLLVLTALPLLLGIEGWLGLWILAQMTIWLGGPVLLYALDYLWPGVLLLPAGSLLLVAFMSPEQAKALNDRPWGTVWGRGDKRKRKRGRLDENQRAIPLPPADDIINDDDDVFGDAVFDDGEYDDLHADALSTDRLSDNPTGGESLRAARPQARSDADIDITRSGHLSQGQRHDPWQDSRAGRDKPGRTSSSNR